MRKHPLLWSVLEWFIMKTQDVSPLVAGSPNIPTMHKALDLAQALHYAGHPGKRLVAPPSIKETGKGSRVEGYLQLYRKKDTAPF